MTHATGFGDASDRCKNEGLRDSITSALRNVSNKVIYGLGAAGVPTAAIGSYLYSAATRVFDATQGKASSMFLVGNKVLVFAGIQYATPVLNPKNAAAAFHVLDGSNVGSTFCPVPPLGASTNTTNLYDVMHIGGHFEINIGSSFSIDNCKIVAKSILNMGSSVRLEVINQQLQTIGTVAIVAGVAAGASAVALFGIRKLLRNKQEREDANLSASKTTNKIKR